MTNDSNELSHNLPRCAAAAALVYAIHFVLACELYLLGGHFDGPRPTTEDGDWMAHRAFVTVEFGQWIATTTLVLVAFDMALQRFRSPDMPIDLRYYPRLSIFIRCRHNTAARVVLVVGLSLVLLYFVAVTSALRLEEVFSGQPAWPRGRTPATGLLACGVAWLADCMTRPGGGTAVAAVCCLLVFLIVAWLAGSGVLAM